MTEPRPDGPADRADVTSSFKCGEYEEYLLIEEEAASSMLRGQAVAPEQEKEVVRRGDSPDSGYGGKGWSSAEEGKQPQDRELEEDDEEWCVVEMEKHRPQGLYGYRYVDYDDEEAEGNIHITDDDL